MTLKYLRFADWPSADRAAWEGLLREGDVFDGRGAGAHWARATRALLEQHYGRWLSWLMAEGADLTGDLIARITPERVRAYGRMLLAEVAPKTVESALRDLRVVAKALAPEGDWTWFNEMTAKVKSWARPKPKPPLPISAPELYAKTLAALEDVQAREPGPRQAIAYRDLITTALLVACPIRHRNLAMMAVGRHLVWQRGAWHLMFEAHETKTRRPLHHILPTSLTPWLGRYLDQIRPTLRGAEDSPLFWPTPGRDIAPHPTLYARLRLTTEALTGTPFGAHTFRTLAATSLAEDSPNAALHAPALLGHTSPKTTETHYIRACHLKASQSITQTLRKIKADGKK